MKIFSSRNARGSRSSRFRSPLPSWEQRSVSGFKSDNPQADHYRIKGTPFQIMEQYISLARDAISSGDWIAAEGFYQHADHYRRVLAVTPETEETQQPSAVDRVIKASSSWRPRRSSRTGVIKVSEKHLKGESDY